MFKKTFITAVIISVLMNPFAISFADPLLLSDAEMQKLKAYFPNEEDSHLVWNGDPIPISLPLNKEKRIVFPVSVTVDVKSALTSDQLQIINNDKSIYLTALKPFASTRIYVTLSDSQKVLLIDLQTEAQASNATAYVEVKQNSQESNGKETKAEQVVTTGAKHSGLNAVEHHFSDGIEATDNLPPLLEGDTYVALVRFAWQQLYAPIRLFKNPLGISRTAMKTDSLQSSIIYGDQVIAHPIASWLLNNVYVTAISLRNKYPHDSRIKVPQDLCGNFVGAVLYPRSILSSAGNKLSDSTTLFVLSKMPFNKATEVCHVSP